MAQFEDIPAGERPFLAITQDAVDLLESITAAEKAQALPYVRIWQVVPKTGLPVHANSDGSPRAPLSLKLVEPPAFGSSVSADVRYRERPPVSLERVSIRTDNPRGILNYRQVELSFMVHRPDALFGNPDRDADSWSSLLVPGAVHAMEYGWHASTGVKNGILNGEGYVNRQSKPPVIIPAVSRIRFATTHYSFRVQPDGQIPVTVTAFEDSEFNLRRAVPGLAAVLSQAGKERQAGKSDTLIAQEIALDPYTPDGRKVLKELQQRVAVRLKKLADAKGFVTFRQVCDVMFADVIEDAYRQLGYRSPSLFLGRFNERCGKSAPKYGGVQLSGLSIGEFKLPLGDVEKRFGSIMKSGEQVTFYNFIDAFLRLFQDSRSWDTRLSRRADDGVKEQSIPLVVFRPVVNGKDVTVHVFDIKREFSRFSPTDRFTRAELGAVTRDQVRKKLVEKGVPMISFFRGNSYVIDAEFDAVGDDPMKSILMRRALRADRQALQDAQVKLKSDALVDPRQLLYSSAIRGEVTMLGNFAFDMFSLVWLDFNVPQWDGPFFIKGHEDVIGPGEFVTRITLQSSGDDPLGTQGHETLQQNTDEARVQQDLQALKPSARPSRRGL